MRASTLLAMLALAGCSSLAPPPAAPVSAEQRSAFAASLAVEAQWLSSWFRGTPVSIAQREDGVLMVDVPREFCFDPGGSKPRPALTAVLDKVAESLRRRPLAQLVLLAAPDDHAAATPLALQRAGAVQAHLRDRGVPARRLGQPTATKAAAVQLRIGAVSP